MQELHEKYSSKGLVVMGFPCNQFGAQEPKSEPEIKEFVKKFNVSFPMFSKIKVNGDRAHPLYKFLLECFPGDIAWNFAGKFVIDQNGVPVKRFGKEPWNEIEECISNQLAQSTDSNL